MVCRLCLTNTGEGIIIFSEEKIQKYITKFLQLKLSPEDPISKIICNPCWQQLDSFQNFCFQIEEAQKTLNTVFDDLRKKANQNDNGLSNTETSDFEPYNPEISLNVLKEENIERFDDDHYSEELSYCLDENTVKVEVHNEDEHMPKRATSSSPETNEYIPIQRMTRQSTLQNLKENSHLAITNKKRKTDPPKKEELEKQEVEKEEKDQSKEKEKDPTDTSGIPKRTRGRPRKGEQIVRKAKPPKVKTAKSEQCSKIFQTAREFDAIIKKHMSLSCDICFVRFVDFVELKRHFRAVHKLRGYAVCCNKKLFKRGLVVDHINVHNNPEHFKCPKCGKVLADRMCLRNHDLLFHQTEEQKTFQCKYCPEKFVKQYLLDHHSIKHIRKDKSKLLCPECGNGFLNESSLTNHINKVHSTDYDKICEICAKIVRGNAAFERHMKEHDGIVQPRVQCTKCGMWLKTKRILVKHMEKHDGKTYSCEVCGKSSASKSALKSHMSYVHDLSRKYSCTLCDKSFKKALGLKEHMTTHTGEVLYTCPHCPTTFNSRANMHSHRKKKHREEWEANRIKLKKGLMEEST